MDKYLKKADGEIYGPVPVNDLIFWASDGRVAPDDQVSDDSTTWQPAPTLPDLGMEWSVEFQDGEPYGPIHLHALSEFVRDAIVSPNAIITHKDSGETRVLSEALLGPLIERSEALQHSVATLRTHLDELREREQTMAKASDQAAEAAAAQEELNRKLEELRSRNRALKEDAKEWESRFREERKSAKKASGKQEEATQKLEADLARLREKEAASAKKVDASATEIESLREELREARRAKPPPVVSDPETGRLQAELEQARTEHKQERAKLRGQVKDLEQKAAEAGNAPDGYRELATSVDGLHRDVGKWKKLYDDEREGARKKEDTLKQRIEELRRNEDAALSRLEEANRRLRHTQRNYEMMAKAGEQAEGGPESVLTMQMSVLMDSHNELSQSYDTLFTQLQDKAGELEHLVTERKEIESRAEERVQGMEATLKREQEEADRARRQLADMQQSHFALVKSYREMNDRFIRIRQELSQSSTPAAAPEKSAPAAKAPAKGSRIRLNR